MFQVKGRIGFKSTKQRQARTVSIPPSLIEYLKIHHEHQEQARAMFGADYRTDLDLIFGDAQGNLRKPDSVSWQARYLAQKAGLAVSLHTLRHTHASVLLQGGVPLANVSKRLGHRDSHTTAKIYQHALPNTDQDVASTWDKLMAEKAQPKPVAQIGTNPGTEEVSIN